MAEAFVYLLTLGLFSCVIVATAGMRHEMLVLACMPPVFVALIVGFIMTLYAGDTFGAAQTGVALLVGGAAGWRLARRLQARALLLAIYAAWATALLLALVAFAFPDRV